MPYNNKYHILIGIGAGLWLTAFLVFIGPFDTADLSITWRAQVMFVYGLIFTLAYCSTIPLQNWLSTKENIGFYSQECIVFIQFTLLGLLGCFWYYRTDLINGDFGFWEFTFLIYLPTNLILLPFVYLARWYLRKSKPSPPKDYSAEIKEAELWKPKIEEQIAAKIYLNPDLTMSSMAEVLDTNGSNLSKIINRGYGLNFNDFINQYRVEAVIDCIHDGQHKTHTLIGIAQNCGFKSKATFNRAFKKVKEISPSEYVKQLDSSNP